MSGREKLAKRMFSEMIKPHWERMFRLAYRLTGSQPEAQDLFQDVLLKLYPRCDRLAEIENRGPWLARIVYNQFIDNKRRYVRSRLVLVAHSVFSENPDLAQAEQDSLEEIVDQSINIRRLNKALATLSDEHRLVINLHDVEGYKLGEVSEITGISLGTLKSRLHRARARMREILTGGT